MATTSTPKLGLSVPAFDDSADIRVVNTNWPILDEAVTNAGFPAALAANLPAQLALVPPMAPMLTNAGMEVWQRGAGPFTADGAYTADRWRIGLGTGSTMSVSRDTANADLASGSQYCLAVTHTIAPGNPSRLQQQVEQALALRSLTVALRARVKTSTASAARIAVQDSVNGYRFSSYHTGSGNYETLTVTAPIAASAGSVLVALSVDASATVYLDSCVLVVGTAAPPYVPMHPADEWQRCQRYYEVLGGTAALALTTYSTAGANLTVTFRYRALKPVTPTVLVNGTWAVTNCSQPTVSAIGLDSFTLSTVVSATGITAYNPNSADDTITVESNP